MKKILITVALCALGFTILWVATSRISPPAGPSPAQLSPAPPKDAPPVPSMPFDEAAVAAGGPVSEASIQRMQVRIEELRETASQLGAKMSSIEQRLADPAEAPHNAALREAKQTLELSMQKMRLEEKALVEFLRNERGGS